MSTDAENPGKLRLDAGLEAIVIRHPLSLPGSSAKTCQFVLNQSMLPVCHPPALDPTLNGRPTSSSSPKDPVVPRAAPCDGKIPLPLPTPARPGTGPISAVLPDPLDGHRVAQTQRPLYLLCTVPTTTCICTPYACSDRAIGIGPKIQIAFSNLMQPTEIQIPVALNRG